MADRDESRGTEKFSITLPIEACEMLDALRSYGLYGKRRATIAANLIIDQLKHPDVERRVEKGRGKASGR